MNESEQERGRIPLKEEELTAQKQQVEAGHVQVDKDVVTEHREVEVPKMREEVTVSRVPAEGRPAEGGIGDDQQIRVPLHEEQVTAQKTPYVREELEVQKHQVQDTETVGGDVRREEARVSREGDVVEE